MKTPFTNFSSAAVAHFPQAKKIEKKDGKNNQVMN